MPPKKKEQRIVEIGVVERGMFEACLLGTTPIWLNRMSQKAQRELLFPSGRKTAAQKQSTLKHVPLDEYNQSPYTNKDTSSETLLEVVAAGVKHAMSSIPLDLPDTGTTKAQLSRLLFAPQDRIPLWGIPRLGMSVVRMADMNKTPDIRTRAVVPQWATKVQITFVKPVLRQEAVIRLLSAAGFMRGIGDWRAEKGSGNFGTFEVVEPNDPRFLHIIKTGGREAQIEAMHHPDFYDDESEELYTWWQEERQRRGFDKESKGNGASAKKSKAKADDAEVHAS
jgi:hypothetical protein